METMCSSIGSLSLEPNGFNMSVWQLANLIGTQGNFSSTELFLAAQSSVMTFLKRQYFNNDYFAGGIGLMVIGLVGRLYSKNVTFIWNIFKKKRGFFTLSIEPDDPCFKWVQEWLCKNSGKDTYNLILISKWEDNNDRNGDSWESQSDSSGYQERPKLMFIPQLLKAQKFLYNGTEITFQLKKEFGPTREGEPDGEDLMAVLKSAGSLKQLVIEGPSREILEQVVTEAMNAALEITEGDRRTSILRWDAHDFYWHADSRLVRPLDSVVLDCDVAFLVKDARHFLKSYKWYCDRGIPHRRGYIFHGPPGCGKTSLIQALAGELKLDIAVVSLSSKEMNDNLLVTAMGRVNPRSLLVLEDVDAVFNQRKGGEEKESSLSFSGLLNAIDGLSAQEGHLLIMTTNHIERLDPALIRPGRVDLRLHIDLASRDQIARMFLRFFPESDRETADKFAGLLPEKTLSPAMVQGYFLMHRDEPEEAMGRVDELLRQHSEECERVAKIAEGDASPAESAVISSSGAVKVSLE